ncbi:hypothetical protein P7K49_005131 [Saguinus oedipus]|uniref:Uncharacterized protein n=1 Tax=Saguinus oedipus TaxID=9490 RepID=A0ABQ9W9F1_SAGOE|nr:hypothetical protein P7K49_005131 [Saguinus oedipus]
MPQEANCKQHRPCPGAISPPEDNPGRDSIAAASRPCSQSRQDQLLLETVGPTTLCTDKLASRAADRGFHSSAQPRVDSSTQKHSRQNSRANPDQRRGLAQAWTLQREFVRERRSGGVAAKRSSPRRLSPAPRSACALAPSAGFQFPRSQRRVFRLSRLLAPEANAARALHHPARVGSGRWLRAGAASCSRALAGSALPSGPSIVGWELDAAGGEAEQGAHSSLCAAPQRWSKLCAPAELGRGSRGTGRPPAEPPAPVLSPGSQRPSSPPRSPRPWVRLTRPLFPALCRPQFETSEMLKPGDPGGSAFLKVDPAYLQHWQQLFPHGGAGPLKGSGAAGLLSAPQPLQPPPPPPPPPERAEPPPDSLRPRPASLSSASSTPASSSTSASSASSASSCAAAAALAGLSALPVSQLPVFAPLAVAAVAAEPLTHKELCLGAASGPGPAKCGGGGGGGDGRGTQRFRCSAEELDYYLYGQQRMEIIPLNQHTSDPNNRT